MERARVEVTEGYEATAEVVDMCKSVGRMVGEQEKIKKINKRHTHTTKTYPPSSRPLVNTEAARELIKAVGSRYARDAKEGREWSGEEVRDLLRTLATLYPGDVEGFEDVWKTVGEENMEGWNMEVSVFFGACGNISKI